ncbi:cupin domain-containing protein [Amycolatopsis anabasis]|uniref:cupin domain-containing protein n=1 Tax=Amycolatopsis anabasis TaxID=1840409 RepID=UPI00131BF905|nr:cupin domain-containing protein [Amycolatopsis anabasis]
MLIRDVSDQQLVPAYGIQFQQIYPHAGEDAADWGVGRCVVEPSRQTEPHSHVEHEMFVIVEGAGVITIDDEEQEVGRGQAVLIPAGARHTFANRSTHDRLVFLNVYWPPSLGPVDL